MNEKLETEYIPIEQLKAWGKNPRLHNLESIIQSIREFGFRDPISINSNNQEIEEGHGRLKALMKMKQDGIEPPDFIIKQNGTWLVPIQRFDDSELNQKRYSLAHNRTQELGEYDEPLLLENLIDLKEDLLGTGYTSEDIDLLNDKLGGNGHINKNIIHKTLAERFLIPPFSVLDARQGYWQERKRTWIALGIKSEIGRGGHELGFSPIAERFGYERERE